MIRLYFNGQGALPWSVDHGAGTIEIRFNRVLVEAPGVSADGDDPENPSEKPQGSIDFHDAQLEVRGNIATISSRSSSPPSSIKSHAL